MSADSVTTRLRPGIIGMGPSPGLRLEKGCVQTFRVAGSAPSTVAAPFSFVSTWTTEGLYNAVRFEYSNYGAATVDVTDAKTAPTPLHAANGLALSYSDITFDDAANGKMGDVWDGSTGSTGNYTIPAKISGTGANTVPTRIWSDWVPQTPVESQEPDSEGLYIINQRSYSATASFMIMQFGTSASNLGNYNANSRRKHYGNVVGGDQVSVVTSFIPAANHQWAFVTGFQALLLKTAYNHGVFGDSIPKGQGSFDNNNGCWGFVQRAPQALTDAGIGAHSVTNHAVSGQGKVASFDIFLNVIRENGLDTALLFPWSPNDAGGSTPWNLDSFKFQVYAALAECRKYGTALIVGTQPPAAQITDAVGDAVRKANNATIRQLSTFGVTVADFDRVVSDNAAPARFLAGLSGDNVHPSSSGHALMALEYQRAIREALGV